MPKKTDVPLVKKSINVPEPIYNKCLTLIKNGIYSDFSELVRDAIKLLLQKYQLL